MKLAIVGWRKFNDFKFFQHKIKETLDEWEIEPKEIQLIISGGATGTDSLAVRWAKLHDIETRVFQPDWNQYGKAAGPIRNSLIVTESTHLIAFPSKQGRGTQDSIKKAKASQKVLAIHWIDN